jgi:uncharacterized ion transporter superfamily protein YfcC
MDKQIDKTKKLNEKKKAKQQNELDDMSKNFLADKNKGIYNYIKKIDKHDIVLYLIIFFIILHFLNKYKFNINHLAMLFFTLAIIYYINDM